MSKRANIKVGQVWEDADGHRMVITKAPSKGYLVEETDEIPNSWRLECCWVYHETIMLTNNTFLLDSDRLIRDVD